MSSIRSASSRTRISTCVRLAALLADVVQQAAGRGDQDLDAGAQLLDLRVQRHAAVDDRRAQGHLAAVGVDRLGTCTASSRVGVSTSARTGWRAGEKEVFA